MKGHLGNGVTRREDKRKRFALEQKVNGNQSCFVRLFRSIGPSNSEYKVVQFGICSQGEATT